MDTTMQETRRKAFVLRIAPGRKDMVPQALADEDLIIGWAKAKGLLDENLSWKDFRKIVHDQYYSKDANYRRSGMATSYLWLFIREMRRGDIIVVPHGSKFYVGEVAGSARYDVDKIGSDSAYRRKVKWSNPDQPQPRKFARAALQSRMKIQGTCADATDLLEEIENAREATSIFEQDLHKLLVQQTIQEIRTGKMDGAGFERFVGSLLERLGGNDVRIISHAKDKGADIVARFRVAGVIQITVAVQAKHYKPKPPVNKKVVEVLLQGMEAESADIGMIITSGTFSKEATEFVRHLFENEGIRIELIDGQQLGSLILEHGVRKI